MIDPSLSISTSISSEKDLASSSTPKINSSENLDEYHKYNIMDKIEFLNKAPTSEILK
jgi:hypothetical protein